MSFFSHRKGRYQIGPLMIATGPNHWIAPEYSYHSFPIVDNNDYNKVIKTLHSFRWGGIYLEFCGPYYEKP